MVTSCGCAWTWRMRKCAASSARGFVVGAPSFSGVTSNGPWYGSRLVCAARSPQAPYQTKPPYIFASSFDSASVRTSGKTAPGTTGTSVRWISSSIRSVWATSSGSHAFPLTMVMPSTRTSGDCSSTIIDIWLEPPGPEPSWSMRTRRWACIDVTKKYNATIWAARRTKTMLQLCHFVFAWRTNMVSMTDRYCSLSNIIPKGPCPIPLYTPTDIDRWPPARSPRNICIARYSQPHVVPTELGPSKCLSSNQPNRGGPSFHALCERVGYRAKRDCIPQLTTLLRVPILHPHRLNLKRSHRHHHLIPTHSNRQSLR